jgi:apolipoprotein N-acyltransferase
MQQLLDSDAGIIAVAAMGIAILSLLICLIFMFSLISTKKKYKRLTAGIAQGNIEQLLMTVQETNNKLLNEQKEQRSVLSEIRNRLKSMKSKIAISRYNAFDKQGSDLSFTVALMDEEANGVLLTGIHSREQTYVYAKPVEGGKSTYNLSPEEKETLNRTLQQS